MNKKLKNTAGAILMVITLVPYCMAMDEQTSEKSSSIFNNILSWLKSAFGTDIQVKLENNTSKNMPMIPANNSENMNMLEMNNSTPENEINKTRITLNNMPENFNESYVPDHGNMLGMPENVNNTKYPPRIPENFENNNPIEINSNITR
ncbi:conserved hypothetical protein [Methanococcus maripaludis C5]|uniref:Uncharacterized protein n=1 Tax=Methanococcus maripaludis (strain C5 / ATCC BAA-1333) TaxID=402880 RepID=A4FYV0_METM5|nr:hypothetical protein [Methanococcus maripaludis]ABO35384.1 conserved hypothetical protein [Methanococcus maripaludis C5]